MTVKSWATQGYGNFAVPMEAALPANLEATGLILQWNPASKALAYTPSAIVNPAIGPYSPLTVYPNGTIGAGITAAAATAGTPGPKGDKGDKGDSGGQGLQGIQGPAGLPGTNGANGTNGIDGTPGTPGTPGTSATVTVGTTTTLAAGAPATVTNSGTASAAVFDFGIPQGVAGGGGGGSSGTVTSFAFTAANGFTGTVVNPTVSPTLSIGTGLVGLLKGNGTGMVAATMRTDYAEPTNALATGLIKNTAVTGAHSIATGADLPAMTATVGGAVPTPPNNATTFLRGDGIFATPPAGTVTSASVTTANGVSATVATATTTPAFTFTLGAITPSSVNGITFSGTVATTMTFPPASASIGYLNIPQNSQSTAYTAVLADSGKHIYHPSADTTARTFTIPANSSVAYPIGTALTFVNDTGAGVVTVAITSDTLVRAGAGTTGSITLSPGNIVTAIKVMSTRWMATSTGA